MEENLFQPIRKRRVWRWVIALLLLGAAAAAAWVVVFRVNQFSLSVIPAGSPEVILEYGETFSDPGAGTLLRGSLFWKEGIDPGIPVRTEGTVEDGRLGKHTITYSAQLRSLRASASRLVRVVDTQCPVITLTPDDPEDLLPGKPYKEAGYTATDNFDGDITDRVIREETEGLVTYSVLDSSGNPAYAEREIPVVDRTPPVITLHGGADYSFLLGSCFDDPGYSAEDNIDGDLTDAVEVAGEVDWLTPGTYPVTYTVRDAVGNESSVTRNFTVRGAPRQDTVTPNGKVIYLTFDDGPGPYTHALLQVLKK